MGDKCFFNLNVSITCLESIRLGAGCQFGNNVVIVDHDHNYKKAGADPLVSSPVIIGQNVWIGANSVILRGAEIGDGAVIAAGSVVKGKVPSGCVYYQKRESVCAPVLSEIRK
ncbi:MAG: acyltransferase [Lachnospiraceae bacterium]|nr:acyltransferase [Lachnospiraceae bacterium]